MKKAGTNIIADTISGRSVKETAKENLDEVRKSVGDSIKKIGENKSKSKKRSNKYQSSTSSKKKKKKLPHLFS